MSKTLDKTLNFAIVGCGVIGPTHARSISHIPGAKLVAVCDIVEEKARRLAENFGIAAYTDYNEMLEREDIDVVNVTTPSGLHAQVGMAAALAGKHVIVEKPIDVTLEKADALIRTCQSAGVKLSTISQHRFDQAIIDLKRANAENCMGPVAEVYAYAATRTHVRIEAEDIVVASVRFKSGALGFIEGNTAAFPGFCARLDIYGDDGGVVIEDDRVKDWKLRSCETYQVTAEAGTPISGTSSAYIWEEAHRRQIEDVANAIRTGQPVFIPGEEGRKPLEIILAIYESARTGKPVMIP
jgi:UDP-N-acetyl-2-amino-2-deoxyglucuronate dehydrogenase